MKAFRIDHTRVVETTYQGLVTANPGDWIVTNEKMEIIVVNDREFHAKFSLGPLLSEEKK